MDIAVVGAGSWGTAVARHLARQGHRVHLWAHSQVVADGINREHRNPRYLSDCDLPRGVEADTNLSRCLAAASCVVYVVPSHSLREVARASRAYLAADVPVIVLTKGIEADTGLLMTQVVAEEIGFSRRVACLSGPNHAEEVSRDMPSASVIAAEGSRVAGFFQRLFHADRFRTYVSEDVVGVEICAAYKNVVAIACGMARGFGTGDNTAAVLMTRGLAEMGRLVAASGGDPMTCLGLAGVGDLVATCTSRHSRNATFGAAFARGETLVQYQERTHMVVEGALACRSIRDLAKRQGVEVPIADAVFAMLYEGATLEDVSSALYAREPHTEFYGFDVAG